MRRVTLFLVLGLSQGLCRQAGTVPQIADDPGLQQARRARDLADVEALRAAMEKARSEASQKNSSDAYLRLALLENWTCEAAYAHQDNKLVKQAAQAGVAAAREAVKLNRNSSDAHWLLSQLLGLLIPHVFGGGPRYGPESTREADKAIELNPRNAEAYIARAHDYFFTPSMFGGSKPKAVEMLKKAIAIDPASDAAATAHIWLAQAYFSLGQGGTAHEEIEQALRLNPERRFAQYVNQQVTRENGK